MLGARELEKGPAPSILHNGGGGTQPPSPPQWGETANRQGLPITDGAEPLFADVLAQFPPSPETLASESMDRGTMGTDSRQADLHKN